MVKKICRKFINEIDLIHQCHANQMCSFLSIWLQENWNIMLCIAIWTYCYVGRLRSRWIWFCSIDMIKVSDGNILPSAKICFDISFRHFIENVRFDCFDVEWVFANSFVPRIGTSEFREIAASLRFNVWLAITEFVCFCFF